MGDTVDGHADLDHGHSPRIAASEAGSGGCRNASSRVPCGMKVRRSGLIA
jgi:hypothetical protein